MRSSTTSRALPRRLVTTSTVAALLTATVTALLTVPVTLSPAAGTTAERSVAALPTITVTLGRTLSVSAPGVRAGWANIDVTGDGRVVVVRFAGDYDIDAFSADYEAFQSSPGRKGREAFERVLHGTRFLGGVVGGSGSIKLARPGTYTVMALNTSTGIKSATFRAAPRSPVTPDRPSTSGTIQARDDRTWGGPATLPHEGRLLLTNRSAEFPHALILQRVEEGTTAAEYQEWMYSNEAEPNFNLDGRLETQMLSPRRRMTVDYRLPLGQYAVMCFETDPRSRMSHVFQGELRMIHLR